MSKSMSMQWSKATPMSTCMPPVANANARICNVQESSPIPEQVLQGVDKDANNFVVVHEVGANDNVKRFCSVFALRPRRCVGPVCSNCRGGGSGIGVGQSTSRCQVQLHIVFQIGHGSWVVVCEDDRRWTAVRSCHKSWQPTTSAEFDDPSTSQECSGLLLCVVW